MEQKGTLPFLTNLQMLVYQVFREVDLLERELSQRQYQEGFQHEPAYSQLYGKRQAVQRFKDLGGVLTRHWAKSELTAWLCQKYNEWEIALEWSREAATNPYGKHLSEVGAWQAEGAFSVYEQWVPVIEWLASSERTKLSQHKEMRKRFVPPIPTEEERGRAKEVNAIVSALYEEVHTHFITMRERQDTLDATQYGMLCGYEIGRNYLDNWCYTIPLLDAFQRRIQDLLEAYRGYIQCCQEQIDTYEQDIARWEQENWCNYYRGSGEPTENERVQYRALFRREYGPEKQRSGMETVQVVIDRLEKSLRVSNEGR